MKSDKFAKELEAAMGELISKVTSNSFLKEVGVMACDLIRKRTRLGFAVREQQGSKEKLKTLTDPYVKFRKKSKPPGPTSPGKSNLTYTGQMLNSLEPKVVGNSVLIGFSNEEARQKAEWVTDGGRPFMSLSKAEVKQIQQKLEKDIGSILSKIVKSLK